MAQLNIVTDRHFKHYSCNRTTDITLQPHKPSVPDRARPHSIQHQTVGGDYIRRQKHNPYSQQYHCQREEQLSFGDPRQRPELLRAHVSIVSLRFCILTSQD